MRMSRTEAPFHEAQSLPPVEDDITAYDTYEPRRFGWALPLAALSVSLLWVGGMVWLARDRVLGLPPVELATFVAALCTPPALLTALLLLAMRTSRAEAERFADTAGAMREEAAQLERIVAGLGDRLAVNRAMLAEQSAAIARLGDDASSRLETLGRAMNSEAAILATICGSLNQTAGEVETRLGNVFDALPRAQAETARLSDALRETGATTTRTISDFNTQLDQLAIRGRTADEVSALAAARLAEQMAAMERTTESSAVRLDATAGAMSAAVDTVLERAADAIDGARRGIVAQGEAMLAMLNASHAALDKTGREGAGALAQRLASVEASVLGIGEWLTQEGVRTEALFNTLGVGIEGVGAQFSRLHATGTEQSRELAAAISALDSSAGAMTETMRIGDATARQLISTAETLLIALDASSREIDETLPAALARLDTQIAASRTMVGAAKPELLALVTAAESTHHAVEAVAGLVSAEREKLAQITASLTEALDAGQDKAATMDDVVAAAIAKARRFAEEAAPQLVQVLMRIRESADSAAEGARAVLAEVMPDAALMIEAESEEAVRRAFDRALPQPLAELGSASQAAVAAATRASEHLTQQLMTIAETTAAVEARIDAERSEREASNQDSFARRVSLLVEALNSSSIDISKTFDHEVTDSAWAAYLKGDRGVFTRRAVRLLDAHDAREIARLHEADPAFRENVNRYIHDFEAMLRQILALRDGSPLGVTLLSSDMGKLYVALAQAIERLRT